MRRLSGRRYADCAGGALLVVSVVHETHSGLLSFQSTTPIARFRVNTHKETFCFKALLKILLQRLQVFFFVVVVAFLSVLIYLVLSEARQFNNFSYQVNGEEYLEYIFTLMEEYLFFFSGITFTSV